MSDVLIIGGGVVGLSLAYELAGHGQRVQLIDAGQPGREASWAGAGILPPAAATADDPLERLTALSNELHRHWSAELRGATGIDNGYRRTGAVYLAHNLAEAQRLAAMARLAQARDITMQPYTLADLAEIEPALAPTTTTHAAYLVPDECQIRNPRHLKALVAGCAARGVEITAGAAAEEFEIQDSRILAVRTGRGRITADQYCLTTGCWTAALAGRLGISPAIKPIRGQILLLSTPQPALARIVNVGNRYLVPRDDGRLLAGSTEEDAGFDRSTTAGAIAGLLDFALSLVPQLSAATVEKSWAGLRPATADGLPYLGRVPDLDNAFIAAGHYRGGLQLSTGTAVVMSQLMCNQRCDVPLDAFALDRTGEPLLAPHGASPPLRFQ